MEKEFVLSLADCCSRVSVRRVIVRVPNISAPRFAEQIDDNIRQEVVRYE
ncbi:MAG TPA: hypothetical protein VFA61_12185 [Candidatus Udaeobacter sp.]|nr:hypothetical protein [Candidatus Udaeobacter sp.]